MFFVKADHKNSNHLFKKFEAYGKASGQVINLYKPIITFGDKYFSTHTVRHSKHSENTVYWLKR